MIILIAYYFDIQNFLSQTHLESELQKQKGKVQSLQIDLDNSEAVQRDFVKLSQSLQVMRTSKYTPYM